MMSGYRAEADLGKGTTVHGRIACRLSLERCLDDDCGQSQLSVVSFLELNLREVCNEWGTPARCTYLCKKIVVFQCPSLLSRPRQLSATG
jgi:hypothetical protein